MAKESLEARPTGRVMRVLRAVPVGFIRAYQLAFSPFWSGGACRFTPSCSDYALVAVRRHGALRGLWLACGRIARCHPFAYGGFDPVPPSRETDGP